MRLVESKTSRQAVLVPVVLGSEVWGESVAVVRRISEDRMLVQCTDLIAVGTLVTVHFPIGDTDDELVARAKVRNHITFEVAGNNEFAAPGLVLDFLDFDENLPLSLPGSRVLH